MTRFTTFCMAMLGIFLSLDAVGQMTVRGVVLDENEAPLIGATVLVKNTTRGTITDVDGNYELQANQGDVLLFSFTGFSSQEVEVGSSAAINVTMKEGANLNEIVVVAYGSQKKVTVTGAVASLKGKEIVKSPAVDMSNSLAGRLPGLTVIQTSGEPGADGARISIRGTNTLGNSSPLVVIDGIPDRDGGFGRLNPADIENITVLKDASAAIYGARAANGALLITTKRGKSGKPTISYSFNQGWAQPTRVPEMSNAVEYANIMNELPIYKSIPQDEWAAASQAIKTTGTYDSPTDGVATLNANYSPEAVKKYGDHSDPWGYPDTDWFGDAFKSWAPQQRHNLDMSGGSDNLTYFASLGYVDQDGYYKNSATYYKQYNFRTNLDAKINDYFKANLGVMVRREARHYPTESAGAIFRMLMRGRPTEPEVWPNGMPGPDIENGQNPYVITTNATGYVEAPTDYTQINGGLEITNPWVKNLKLTLSGAVDKSIEDFKRWQTPWMLYYWDRVSYEADGKTPLLEPAVRSNFTDPRLFQATRNVLNTNLTGLLSYDFKLGTAHSFGLLAGVTKEQFTGSNYNAFRRNFISAAVDQLFAGGTVGQNTGGGAYERARLGYYGRAQYNYNEKYLAEFIWRYDASYIFPPSSRYGFFPGLLLGWNVTEEDWFNVNGLDYLKLRASYGQMGNDQVFYNGQLQEYAYLPTYGFGQYPIDNVVEATLVETVLANPDFTWERANNFNFGIDGNLFGKLDFSLEYFKNRRDQILIQKTGSTPASSGISNLLPPVNAGKVDNSGFEYSFLYSAGRADFRWSAGLNGGYAENKVVFMDEIPGAPDYQRQEGKPIGAYLVYESDGVFKDQAAIEANTLDYSAVTGTLIPGDMKFKDINGDGKIDADDQKRLDQNATPKFFFGGTFNMNVKNFDFSLLFQGATGALLRLQTESGDIGNFVKYQYDNRWSIDNPSDKHPRLASRGDTYFTGGSYGNNTYYLLSKNYVRLKNIEIGYTFGRGLNDRIHIRDLRVYVNALNLLTLDKFKIFDPETESQSGVYYPQARVINMGASLSF
ncbi:MAG: SusC/RagA family TonB-linked outer membrane protein [Bacteroidetes bacterium]|nr:SusC/RagA family TonB-linked outer membrane protein [Bacteroidota bacterium]